MYFITHISHHTHPHPHRALRKKHGAKARTNLDLNLIPRWKAPTDELDMSKQFKQGKGVGGNQASVVGLFFVYTSPTTPASLT